MTAWFPTAVYLLSFLTSGLCGGLLARSYLHTKTRLLLWSALCFLFLALNNLAVIIDLLVLPQENFSLLRVVLSVIGVSLLLFGLVWNREEGR
ncbi:MAG: hypothetical protein J7494_12945 [Sphingobium sp.]|nr:hypothetical protein [Sphingobium sp.]